MADQYGRGAARPLVDAQISDFLGTPVHKWSTDVGMTFLSRISFCSTAIKYISTNNMNYFNHLQEGSIIIDVNEVECIKFYMISFAVAAQMD